ncbi:MAG: branched-chain amino acid ABC transporter permease [Pseudomonadota bacterium]
MSARLSAPWAVALAALVALPFVYRDPYHLHILVLILIWSFAYTSWSMMGRFGLVSLGHGGFMGVGAYVTALLWNHLGISPWIGIPIALVCAGALALVVAYPCFRFRITGHYFALVTLALSGIVLQVITATRDYTGGSLGYTPERTKGNHIVALQFDDKTVWYLIALGVWACGLAIWYRVDRSMARSAMEAISEDEDAAAAAGVNVTAEKLKITVLSAMMTALAGALYCQYQMFISPDTVSGIAVSLQMVFAVVVGGLYVALGPTVGAIITLLLAESLRIFFGTGAVGWDNLIYGLLLVLFIIFLPKGILGTLLDRLGVRRGGATRARAAAGAAPG